MKDDEDIVVAVVKKKVDDVGYNVGGDRNGELGGVQNSFRLPMHLKEEVGTPFLVNSKEQGQSAKQSKTSVCEKTSDTSEGKTNLGTNRQKSQNKW